MNAGSKLYKPMLLALCAALLCGVAVVQRGLNRDRERLGLTHMAVLENAPPVLAFTTVAMGGVRGLIANALWIRMNELQDEDRCFEMVQLADWITKLEPRFTQVWIVQAWNMAYNISVKFKSPEDRWRWVTRGIELLRDDGLRYNPDDTLIYRELSWFFQHKMGQNTDDAHWYYKEQWYKEMNDLLGKKPNYAELLKPQTEEARQRVRLLRNKYKMDPAIMKEIDERYGPMEWRLPDAHAVYWADIGRRRGRPEEQERLQRSIYQTLQNAFRRGALYETFDGQSTNFILGPNLDAVQHVSDSYEELMKSPDPALREQPVAGHRNFLRDAVYFLYLYNRKAEAEKWFNYLKQKYPTAAIDYVRSRFPNATSVAEPSLEDFVLTRVTEDVVETDVDRIVAIVGGFLQQSFLELVRDNDDAAAHNAYLAEKIWNRFQVGIEGAQNRLRPPPLSEIKKRVLDGLLDPATGLPPVASAKLRTRLGLPPAPEVPAKAR